MEAMAILPGIHITKHKTGPNARSNPNMIKKQFKTSVSYHDKLFTFLIQTLKNLNHKFKSDLSDPNNKFE